MIAWFPSCWCQVWLLAILADDEYIYTVRGDLHRMWSSMTWARAVVEVTADGCIARVDVTVG